MEEKGVGMTSKTANEPSRPTPGNPEVNTQRPTAYDYQPPPVTPGQHAPRQSQVPKVPRKQFSFSDKSIRRNFIRKVYGILVCQLAVTFGIISIFMFCKQVKEFVIENITYFIGPAFGVMLFCVIALSCCVEARRKVPLNYIFLGVFTIIEGFFLGCVCLFSNIYEVYTAIGITGVLVLGLTLFALQTKIDFTVCGALLLGVLLSLSIYGALLGIYGTGRAAPMAYSAAGALLFSFYLIYDTQRMLSGKYKYTLSPEDYIFAALNLYVDVVMIFLYVLNLSGKSRN